jgi:hypothetical protein
MEIDGAGVLSVTRAVTKTAHLVAVLCYICLDD